MPNLGKDQVGQFLTSLSTLTHGPINEAYNVLGRLKRQLSSSVDKTGELVNPWDRDYLVNQFNRRMINADFSASFIELRPYLQPGQILFALSQLYQELFEIQLEPVPVAECEIWHSDVRKLNVYQLNGSATRTLLGSIYLDLFARNGKPTGAAHYTVRCGRRIWDWEADLCPKLSGWDGIGQREKRQTALVVLGCSAKNREYFTVEEVETLFHEMGHALHSMVSQSDYHHVAGTRCQLDFVEIPSVLAEKFATHPTFLESSLYHPQTQDLIPKGLFNDYLVKTRHTKEAHTLRLLELHQQLLLSQVDLTFHSASSSPQQPLLELLRRVEQDPLINPTSIKREKTFPWPMSIAHLGSYGSGYYSYLVARIVSERMWREAFYSKSLAKQHGPRYLKSVLQWGGSRDGWECLSDFFQAPIKGQSLLKGDDGSGWMDEWIKNL